jgi:hypothetical protein
MIRDYASGASGAKNLSNLHPIRRAEAPASSRKRVARQALRLVDLDLRAESGGAEFLEAGGDGAGYSVQTFCGSGVLA